MNTFYDLGIYGKENIVSNFYSWILNPKESHNLGNIFINNFFKKISMDLDYDTVNIFREYYGVVNKKSNYIDIVIEVMKDNIIVGVVAIENKTFSKEGLKQTERYLELLNEQYVDIRIIPIYLTLENIPIKLTSSQFIHMKYSELDGIFSCIKNKVSLIDDFIEAYIVRKREKEEVYRLKTHDFKELIEMDDLKNINDSVCRMISYILNDTTNDMLALYDYSAKGGNTFFFVTSNKWDIIINGVKCNIHLEGDIKKLVIHFEVAPYRPISKLNYVEKETFENGRRNYREVFSENIILNSNFQMKKINGNDKLTVYKLENKSLSFLEYLGGINDLFNQVDQILSSHNTLISDMPVG